MNDTSAATGSGSRGHRGLGTRIVIAVILGALAGLLTARAADAAVSGITSSGSIVYVKGNDLWLTNPDGVAQKRVTTDGNTPTADSTGQTGYDSPSQSDSGDVIVAVRNERRTGNALQTDGHIWVMDRQGQ